MSRHHPVFVALAVLVALTALNRDAAAQSQASVELWVRAGLFRPTDGTFGRVYPGARVPFTVQADWRLLPLVAVFGGFRYLHLTGDAVAEAGQVRGTSGGLDARVTMSSGRFGGLLLVPGRRWDARLGGGVTVTHHSESWPAAGASASGTEAGWLVQAAVARRFGSRWSAGLSVEYAGIHVPPGSGGFAGPAVDIGGLDVLFGAGVRF